MLILVRSGGEGHRMAVLRTAPCGELVRKARLSLTSRKRAAISTPLPIGTNRGCVRLEASPSVIDARRAMLSVFSDTDSL